MQELNELERRRLSEQAQIDSLKGAEERNRQGQYATPPALAKEVVRLALTHRLGSEKAIRFFDPAIGTGAFYSALLQSVSLQQIEQATGVEVDTAFAQVARQLWATTGLKVIEADFTQLQPELLEAQPNLLICNPPYIRHHHLSQEAKPKLQEKAFAASGYRLNGLAGMYCYFLLLAHHWLQDGGLGVWLIPTEFMDVNYGRVIRAYLTEQVTLRQIHRFEATEVQFADALVSSAIVVFEKSVPHSNHQVIFSIGGIPTQPEDIHQVPLSRLRNEQKWTRAHKAVTSTDTIGNRSIYFGDLFETRRGLVTGANDYFIVKRTEAEKLDWPRECYRPILPSPRYLKDAVIKSGADGYPLLEPQLVLLDCSLPEEYVREKHPELWAYLEYGKAQELHKRYLTSRRDPWYQQEQRPPTPFICTYMGRGQSQTEPFRFFWNQSSATVPNVYLLVYPREPLATYLHHNVQRQAEVFELLTQIATEKLVDEGRTYGGGLHKIEPRELHRVPLTNIPLAQELRAATSLF